MWRLEKASKRIAHILKTWAKFLKHATKWSYSQAAITCSKLAIETLEQRYEICSKLIIKPPKRRQWRRFGGVIVNFQHISHLCSSVSIVNSEQVNAGLVYFLVKWQTSFQKMNSIADISHQTNTCSKPAKMFTRLENFKITFSLEKF